MVSIAIDIGTTTISTVVVDVKDGSLVASETIQNGSFIDTGKEWQKIQDPSIIIGKVEKLVDRMFEEYKEIAVIGLTGQMHGVVYVDENGKHCSPLYTWQDGSGNQECFDGKSICQILQEKYQVKANTGYGMITYLYHCRKGLVPENAVKACTIMDYLGMVLTGRKTPLTHSSNAASLGLYDAEKVCFLSEILEAEGGKASMAPDVTDAFEVLGSCRGVPVSVALGDNQASFLGSVSDAANAILVNMGTGGQISVLSDVPFVGKGIEARPFAEGKYLLAGASLCGGRAYAILKNFFEEYAAAMGVSGVDHYAVMAKLLESFDKKKDRMQVTTTFSGTREEPKKKGGVAFLDTDNFHPADLTYGVLEGMGQELYEMYEGIVEGLHIQKTKMVASGNGIRKNKYLQEIMCEKFHMTLQMAEHEEEAAYGAAKSGMIAAGLTTLAETIGI